MQTDQINISTITEDQIEMFNDIVIKNIKNINLTDQEDSLLRNNLKLWLYCLRTIRKEVEYQLSSYKKNMKSLDQKYDSKEYILNETRRINSIKFLTAVEKKLIFVKLLVEYD